MGSIARFLACAGAAWCTQSSLAHAEEPTPTPSRADCVAHHEQAQDARLASQLLSARSELRQCSAAACPALVSRDCVGWLSEVEQQIPSVIFRATKDGEDLVALHVSEGERVLTDSLNGSPFELDPGPHQFVAELPGFAPEHATYVLQAGDKARVVRFDFVSPKPAPVPSPASVPSPPAVPPPKAPRPIPKLSYALGGVTLAAAASGGVLGVLALSKRKQVEQRCAPLCLDRDVSGVKSLALAADIAFAVALVGAGVTVYSYVARPEVPAVTARPNAPTTARISVLWSGLGLSAEGNF